MYARRALAGLLLLGACSTETKTEEPIVPPLAAEMIEPAPLRVQRLTARQYRTLLNDLFGEVTTPPVEPDFSAGGLISVGAAETSISPWGVEQYESSALAVARQVFEDETRREALLGCAPSPECARTYLADLATRAWRRPVTDTEADELAMIANGAAQDLGGFWAGLELGVALVLQSPYFLYRIELGEPAPDMPGTLRYTSYEMASRLSFLFWNAAPDAELLAAAEAGELVTDEGVKKHAERLLASDRAKEGVRNFFTEQFELYLLDKMTKDPTIFTYYSPQLGASAKEQTLLDLEHLIFSQDEDVRKFLTSTETFVDRRLAALYGVQAPSRDGFALAELDPRDGRRGFLGQASFLALRAHPVGTSATLRGKFVLEVLLCRHVPPPPVMANTAIPEVSPDARTLRERLIEHQENPACATCHKPLDGVGLGFEQFDGIGRFREMDNDAPIDPSGNIDDILFTDAWDAGRMVAEHEDLPRCLASSYYRYATGNPLLPGEEAQVEDITERFVASGHRVKKLLVDIALSPGFRRATEAE